MFAWTSFVFVVSVFCRARERSNIYFKGKLNGSDWKPKVCKVTVSHFNKALNRGHMLGDNQLLQYKAESQP